MPKTDTASPKKPARRVVDWEAVERDYRAGLKSLREIGKDHGVSHVAVKKRADREDWVRDLSSRIKAKADALVNSAELPAAVTAETKAADNAIVEANATAIMRVRLAHRKDIARARAMANRLLEELETTTADPGLYAQIQGLVALTEGMSKKDADKLAGAVQKTLELPNRTATMKMLADTMTKLIGLEREAYSLKTDDAKSPDDDGGVGSIKALLTSIDGAGTGLPSHAGQPAA